MKPARISNPPGGDEVPATAVVRPNHTLAYIIGGSGVALLATSGIFYILQRGKDSELQWSYAAPKGRYFRAA